MAKPNGKLISCPTCGKQRYLAASHIREGRRFCSSKCSNLNQERLQRIRLALTNRIKTNCRTCNVVMLVIPARLKDGRGRYCSMKCRNSNPEFLYRIEVSRRKACKRLRDRSPEQHPQWRGGLSHRADGYILQRVNKRAVLQHRHVIETSIGRKLKRLEYVHHRNGNKQDNRLDNLRVMTAKEHSTWHVHVGHHA